MRKQIILYEDQYAFYKELKSEKLLVAFVEYMFEDIEPTWLNSLEQTIRNSLLIRMNNQKNKSNAWTKSHWWWAKEWNQNAMKNWDFKQNNNRTTTETTTKQQEDKDKDKDKDKVKDKDKEKINNHPTDEFDDALFEFVKMRKQIRKPITEKWLELIKDKLNKMYPDNKELQIKCLYKSIENSWQWIFELSEKDIKWYSPPIKKRFIAPDPNKVLSLNEL